LNGGCDPILDHKNSKEGRPRVDQTVEASPDEVTSGSVGGLDQNHDRIGGEASR
jgi:hypothetical protein